MGESRRELYRNNPVKNKDLNYEKEWNGFWNFYNVMQFSSFFYGVSTIGINSHVYNTFEQTEESSIVSHEVVDAKWNEILETIQRDFEITDVSFKTWLLPLKLHSLNNNIIYILVSDNNDYGLKFIRNRYYQLFKIYSY